MDLGIKGRTALVVASSEGIGRAVAESLAREGCRVAMCARRGELLEQAAKAISARTGAETLAIAGDVSVDEDVARIIEGTRNRFGSIDILVNNAGGPPTGTFEQIDMDQWEAAFRLNLRSTVLFCQQIVPSMRQRRWGRVVNLASISVKQPVDGLMLSNSLRAGVAGFSKTLATEAAAENVLVNVVCPGYTLTQRLSDLAEDRAGQAGLSREEILESMKSSVPTHRLAEPEEIADLAAFLCSERASSITGTVIAVDGGLCRSLL